MIRVGPAGWSYEDWKGIVYPQPQPRRFDPLVYLAEYFDTIEVNSSFYHTPPVTHATSWVRRVAANPDFRFTAKLFRGFTHETQMPAPEEMLAFRSFLDALAAEERLGAVLLQFPWSFKNDEAERARIATLCHELAAYPRVVEVRHASFQTPDFLTWLDEIGAGWTNLDQPIFGDSVKPSADVTGSVAYARLHGRNYEKWFAPNAETWERYDYLYSAKELEPWVERIESMAATGKDVYVVTNNHFRGQAPVNALELKRQLGQPAAAPPSLVAAYPDRLGR